MNAYSFRSLSRLGFVVTSVALATTTASAQSLALAASDGPPNGASANLVMPAVLPDGSFATPNRDLSDSAAAWHFRAAMNVAALECGDLPGGGLVSAYNAMLTDRKDELAKDEHATSAEFAAGPAGRAAYDDAMTRLYNFFAQPAGKAAFCAAAAQALSDAADVPAGGLAAYAKAVLPALDRPFTNFYQAYAAWQARRAAPPAAITIAAAATVPVVPKAARRLLELDLSDLVPETTP